MVLLSVKERILTIRLLEHIAKQPAFADVLGVTVIQNPICPAGKTDTET